MKLPEPIRELTAFRELLWMLAWRDIRVRYKHSLLGAAWAVVPPVLTMLIFAFVFCHAMRLPQPSGDPGTPYPLFALCGLVPWTYFTAGLGAALTALVGNRNLVTKVSFPREVFPLAGVAGAAADFLVGSLALAVLIAWYHLTSPWKFQPGPALLLLPAAALIQTALVVGLGFLLAMGNLYYRDVGFVFRTVLPLLMFVTNVLYPLRSDRPAVQLLIALNPMVPILDAYRAALLPGAAADPLMLSYSAAVATVVLVGGWTLFHRCEYTFAERI